MTLDNMELVYLVTRAYDEGFRAGFSLSDYGGDEKAESDALRNAEYLIARDDWIRSQIPEGTDAG